MNFHRGRIAEVIAGPRWRVKHCSAGSKTGVVDIVGGETEEEARQKVLDAYTRDRVIVSIERLD